MTKIVQVVHWRSHVRRRMLIGGQKRKLESLEVLSCEAKVAIVDTEIRILIKIMDDVAWRIEGG